MPLAADGRVSAAVKAGWGIGNADGCGTAYRPGSVKANWRLGKSGCDYTAKSSETNDAGGNSVLVKLRPELESKQETKSQPEPVPELESKQETVVNNEPKAKLPIRIKIVGRFASEYYAHRRETIWYPLMKEGDGNVEYEAMEDV